VFLGRRVYAVFGVIGIALYLGDLANKVFRDSLAVPVRAVAHRCRGDRHGPALLSAPGPDCAPGSTTRTAVPR
jgi:hypothetical protein